MGKGTAAEGGDGGNSSHIRTFLRIRPSKRPSGYIKVDEYDKTRLGFHVPVETRDGEVRRGGIVVCGDVPLSTEMSTTVQVSYSSSPEQLGLQQ